jgi:hypothetical protein
MEKLEDLNKDHLLNQQLIDMGFENYSPILNLGGVFLLIVFYFIQLGLALILKIIMKVLDKRNKNLIIFAQE